MQKDDMKRTIGKLSQSFAAQSAAALAIVATVPTVAYNVIADDLDTSQGVEQTAETESMRQDLREIRELATAFERADRAYDNLLPNPAYVDEYREAKENLRGTAEFERLLDARNRAVINYQTAANEFRTNLVLSPAINEVTYGQFADLMPDIAFNSGDHVDLDGDGASLNECRVKYGENVAADRVDIAEDVADCMRRNDRSSGWMLFAAIVASIIMSGAGLVRVEDSPRMKRWAQIPKSQKPEQN